MILAPVKTYNNIKILGGSRF